MQQSAIGGNQLDAFRRCFNDGTEALFAFFRLGSLLLDRLEEARIVNGNSSLFSDALDESFCPFRKDAHPGMTKEKSANHFT